MTIEPIPDEHDCMKLLQKHECPDHIVLHSRMVWTVAKIVGEGLLREGIPLDMELLKASCLLHDIAKYPCLKGRKGWHDAVGEEMLIQEGLPTVAAIIGQHVILKDGNGGTIREEHVLFYSDKRVVHDKVVSLEDRFQYLADTYGKSPRALEGLNVMKDKTQRLEERLFQFLDFAPEDLPALVESAV